MIPFNRYVSIVSGVGGGSGVRLRDLITRIFTPNELIPPQSYIEFTDAASVGALFGTASEEYARASFYFGFISKLISKPNKISFARFVPVATAPKVWGNTAAKALATFTAVAAGSLKLTMGADTVETDAINLTAAASLAAVAASIQAALRASAAVQFAGVTVTYDATTNRFNLAGGVAGAGAMAVLVPAIGTDLSPLLGWTAASGAIINAGSAIETITQCLATSAEQSNNFASFLFMPGLTAAQRLEAATWNKTQNQMYLFLARATDTVDAAQAYTDCANLSGVAVTLSPQTLAVPEHPAMLPGMVLAATDYTKPNASQNYMFQQAALTPSVLTGAVADAMDAIRCNYYGRTQTGGQMIDFYQRGTLMGLATDATDMNVYANEVWLKDAVGSSLLSLLLSLGKVSANIKGRAQLIAQIATAVAKALDNGVISVGKTLNTTQKLYIGQLTNDPLAWAQVQNLGYWLDCNMVSFVTSDGRNEWKAVYTLIYSKDDTIRKVEGSHVLI